MTELEIAVIIYFGLPALLTGYLALGKWVFQDYDTPWSVVVFPVTASVVLAAFVIWIQYAIKFFIGTFAF